jgi:dTDP-4-amino-4,6-dideoxygalactose transaminase
VDGDRFGLARDQLAERLGRENVSTRKYFSPPLHRQTAYQQVPSVADLSVSDELASTMITLPLNSHMPMGLVDEICDLVRELHEESCGGTL